MPPVSLTSALADAVPRPWTDGTSVLSMDRVKVPENQ